MDKNQNMYWLGKKAKIEIVKDERRLIFTAKILEFSNGLLTFSDRDGLIYSFNVDLIKEMKLIEGDD